jgi:predicted transcriptional regulator
MGEVDYNSKAWSETRATQIFHFIHSGDVAYASGIATKLDLNSQTVKNYIDGLVDRGLVSEKERIRGKIIYESNLTELSNRFYENILVRLKENIKEHERLGSDTEYLETVLENCESQKNRIESTTLIENYLDNVFEMEKAGTIHLSLTEILTHEFSFTIIRYFYRNEDLDDWFVELTKAVIYSGYQGWSMSSMEEAMEDR